MLISSRNMFTDTTRNDVSPAIWASLSPAKLTHKINHHTGMGSVAMTLNSVAVV